MQQSFGRYRLLRHLATGGMGEVYLAEAPGAAGFAKRLVIKTLRSELAADPRLVAQFVAEGRLLEALDHPNIAQILDLGQENGVYFLAMEYVEGFDLRELLRALVEPSTLAEGPALCVLAATAEALDHAATRVNAEGQALNIVHHDVTPSNIMVRPDGHVKLVDFGVARSAVMARLRTEALRGKLAYLSPEQARMGPVDGRADIFSLGLVTFELLAGSRALEAADLEGLSAAHALLPEKLSHLRSAGISEATIKLLREMLALDRGQRCASAEEVAERAKQVLVDRGEGFSVRPVAEALRSAFELLEQRRSGFNQTLASMVAAGSGLSGASGGDQELGTVSLPGLPQLGVAVQGQESLAAFESPQERTSSSAIAASSLVPALEISSAPGISSPVPLSAVSLGALSAVSPGASPSTSPGASLGTSPGTGTLMGLQRQRLRKRVVFAAVVVLLMAGALGWWIGARGQREGASTQPEGRASLGSSASPVAGLATSVTLGQAVALDRSVSPTRASAQRGVVEVGATDASSPPAPDSASIPTAAALSVSSTADSEGVVQPSAEQPPTVRSLRHRSGSRPEVAVRNGVFRFLVFPADCEVRVDGRRWPASRSGRYALSLSAGHHVIFVREPISGRSQRFKLKLAPGEQRTMPGGFRLVTGLP